MDNYDIVPIDLTKDTPITAAMQPQEDLSSPMLDQSAMAQPFPPLPISGPSGFQNFLQNPDNAGLMLAMAGGMGSGRTPLQGLGNAFTAANEHLQYQDKLKMLQEQRKDALQLKQDQLAETKRLNAAKINELGARADKEGTPKVLNKLGGYTTLYWPKTGQVSTHTDEEVQHLFENEQQRKLMSAALMGGMKADNTPLPSPVLKDINESQDAIQASNNVENVLDKTLTRLSDGSLDLGALENLINTGRQAVGWTTEQSRAYESLKSDLNGLRNSYLSIQKGTQTEGDAKRAWDQLITNLRDPVFVAERAKELKEYNRRAVAEHQQRINAARTDNGKEPVQFDPKSNLPVPVNPQSAVDKNIAAVQKVFATASPKPTKQQYPDDVTNTNKMIADLKVTILNPSATPEQKKAASDKLVQILNKTLEPGSTVQAVTPLAPGGDVGDVLQKAADALKRGADRNAVFKRLRDAGIDPTGI